MTMLFFCTGKVPDQIQGNLLCWLSAWWLQMAMLCSSGICVVIYGLWVNILTYHPQEVHIKFVIELYYRLCTLLNKVNKMICLYAYMCLYTFCIFPFIKSLCIKCLMQSQNLFDVSLIHCTRKLRSRFLCTTTTIKKKFNLIFICSMQFIYFTDSWLPRSHKLKKAWSGAPAY